MKIFSKMRFWAVLLLLALILQSLPLTVLAEELANPEIGEGDAIGGDGETNDGDGIEEGDGEPDEDGVIDYSNAIPVTSSEELEAALADGQAAIRIDADFLLDRTFYVTQSTILVSDAAHTLKRAPSFGGDIFVVGEASDGSAAETAVVLTVGKPDDATPSMIVIEGDAESMTAEVVGSVFFVRGGSRIDLYDNLTVKGHVKTGNERTHNEAYSLSYPTRIGGAVAIVSSHAYMRIFGGSYLNNRANDITDSETEEGMLSSFGGAFFNYGTLDVYGGRFEGNHAARAGVFYNYRTLNLYGAEIVGNTASTLGGAIYVPASTAAYLYIGEDNDVTESGVVFENNTAQSSGGAIYVQHVATVKNAEFKGNVSVSGSGGAICASSTSLELDNCVFESNTASAGYGGGLYMTGTRDTEERDLTVSHTEFTNNSAKNGGALCVVKGAKTYFAKVAFEGNDASSTGGAIYATGEGTLLEINGATVGYNSASGNGGVLYLATTATALLNDIKAIKNESQKGGGFAYVTEAELTLYNSSLEENTATVGGAVNVQTGGALHAYNTRFIKNTATSTQGGALMIYTGGTESTLHTCVFENNVAENFGGCVYISNKSHLNAYNITATGNSATKGGFMYITTTGTVVNLIGTIVSDNTATEGGPIIWGNSTGAKLNIDKLKYVDNSNTGEWDDAYWASAIYNSLTVKDVRQDIPPYGAYGTGELVEPPAPQSITDVKTPAELERALEVGYTIIRITADFEIDRTFYVTANTTIYATQDRILKRAASFGGDIFVVGMNADGERVEGVTFVLGKTDGTDAALTIDGNAGAMTADVVGTVVLVCDGAKAELGNKLCVCNHTKVGNERVLTGFAVSSYPGQVGGAVAIIEQGAEMHIYGGSYLSNCATDIAVGPDAGKISYGGAFFNHGKLYVHDGLFQGNSAGRGGVFYNYRTMWMYGGEVSENSASTLGGAIYVPNTTSAYLYICNPEMGIGEKVYFIGNTAEIGGAIYAQNLALITNTVFENNSATDGSGGAIYALSTRMTLDSCVFSSNTSSKYGGAIYLSGSNKKEETPELTVRDCTFDKNSATTRAGVLYLSGKARAYFTNSELTENSSATGGAFYVIGASLEIDNATIVNNTSSGSGGVLYLVEYVPNEVTEEDPIVPGTFLGNRLTVQSNTATTYGGFAYLKGATAEVFNSEFSENTATASGGVAYAAAGSSWRSYNTLFRKNKAATKEGGALFVYTNGVKSIIHSCIFEENTAENFGGAIYASGKAALDMYNITATGNTAFKGGFFYETTTGTVIKLVGLTLSGNAATGGGPIIWGNSTGAKLYIDKSQYRDLDTAGALNDAYWADAIVNKLTVSEISESIPKYLDYRNEAYDQMADAMDVSNAAELEAAILAGCKHIRIIADILVDRTFYITGDVTIFTTIGHTLTRDPSFAGDFFVVGEGSDGTSSLLMGNNAKLTLGNPYSESENFLVIDGNKDNMLVDVVGSVIFICNSGSVDIHKNVTVMNCHKVGNEKTLNEKYRLSIANRIGGTLAVVGSGVLNIYGGTYKNNSVNEEIINGTDETGRNSTVGGLIFNNSNVNIYGGTFEGNQAARGGVIYSYRITRIFGGRFENNVATVSGGVYYSPNSAQTHLYIGDNGAAAGTVVFVGNQAKTSGGVIYAASRSANVIYGGVTFDGNKVTNGNGGVIAAYGQLTVRDSIFQNNSASSRGGTIYASNALVEDTVRHIEITGCTFKNNAATFGGALAFFASSTETPQGAIVTLTDSAFTGNMASLEVANASSAYGGAIYMDRKAELKAQGCTFTSNKASTEGGAVYVAGESKIELISSTLTKNSADKFGGAITVRSSYLTVDDTDITKNTSASNGGAIYVSYQSAREINACVTIKNSLIKANSSGGNGGAIYATRRDIEDAWNILTVTDTDFENNTAIEGGGALATMSGVKGYFANVSFLENTVTGESADGGALYLNGSDITLNGASFESNSAVSSGGAIFLDSAAKLILHEITALGNEGTTGGFAYLGDASEACLYDSTVEGSTTTGGGGAIYVASGSTLKAYNTTFKNNIAEGNGGALYFYTGGSGSVLHGCSFIENKADGNGGAIYVSNASIVDIYDVTATSNVSASYGGFMYQTTSSNAVCAVVTLNGATVSGNTADKGGNIIWGNSNAEKARLVLNKARYTDLDHSEVLDDAYWGGAVANSLTVEETNASVPTYKDYVAPTVNVKKPTVKTAGSVDEIFALDGSTGSEYISSKYENFPVLDNSSNFMSDGVTYFENINGGTVTVDSFVYGTNAKDGNCTVGEGLLIYQAMLYKKAHPEENVSIHLSAYRVSVEAAVNINRNNRYFGYMRNLGNKEYDANGFVRVSYLLVSAARMGINVTVIGQIDGYPRNGGPTLHDYFNGYLDTECDTKYAEGKVSDYMNFAECFWTLDSGKGGTDMMHTKLCAVSHYLDIHGVEHKNAVYTTSANLDGINSSGTNGNYKLQTATIVSDHEYLYRISVNYLNLVADYCGQERIYEFQDIMSRVGADQIEMILDGRMNEIPADELLVYLGTENDDVFELYFTPFAGPTTVWDEQNNPYCKYIREMYNSEDSIIFVWNAAEYSSAFPLGDQMEDVIVGSFYNNKNVENKFFGVMENFDKTKLDGLTVGVDVGYISVNQKPFGSVHNKDILLSYVKDGQRYYVSLLNSCNMHSGSMCYQSNFMLVIKETDCEEDSVFFTMADLSTTGIVEHTYGEETSYIPEDGSHGYYYLPCLYCDKQLITEIIHRPGEWIVDREATFGTHGIQHKNCTACGLLMETKEVVIDEEELENNYTDESGVIFDSSYATAIHTGVTQTPYTFEALLQLPEDVSDRGGVIVSNYDGVGGNQISLEVYTYGRIRLFVNNGYTKTECFFATDIRSDDPVHIAVTVEGTTVSLYVNGEFCESAIISYPLPAVTDSFDVGGDRRRKNSQYFKGTIYSVSLFADIRTPEEIRKDAVNVYENAEALLYSREYYSVISYAQPVIGEGKTFDENTSISLDPLSQTPHTIEAIIAVPLDHTGRAGVVFGNYDGRWIPQINLEIYENGVPRLYINTGGNSETYLFDADVRSESAVHLALTISEKTATLYINGEAVDTVTLNYALPSVTDSFKIGGDNRDGNTQYFKGVIYAVGLYADARTAEEIRSDSLMIPSDTDAFLYAAYYVKSPVIPEEESEGETFTPEDYYDIPELSSVPKTIEAVLRVPVDIYNRGGVILGNYDNSKAEQLNLEIYSGGRIRVFVRSGYDRGEYIFLKDIRSEEAVHIAVTLDGKEVSLYVNGVFCEKGTLSISVPDAVNGFKLGGDNREGNTQYFRGEMFSAYIFSDVRSAEEIEADYHSVSIDDPELLYSVTLTDEGESGEELSYEMSGQYFEQNVLHRIDQVVTSPHTIEATLMLPLGYEGRGGVIVGNYFASVGQVNLEIYTGGRVRLFFINNSVRTEHIFNTDIRSDSPIHIAVTVDGTLATLYINGEVAETAVLPATLPTLSHGYVIGGDRRTGNVQYFKGIIYSVALFDDVRTADEIKCDVSFVPANTEGLLYSTMFANKVCYPYAGGNEHAESDWIVDREATALGNGVKHKECLVCGKILSVKEISNTVHDENYIAYDKNSALQLDSEKDAIPVGALGGSPKTFEVLLHLDPSYTLRAGVLIGSYDGSNGDGINLEIYKQGKVRLYYKADGIAYSYVFTPNVCAEGLTHIALTVDGLEASLYVNGALAQTITLDAEVPEITEGFYVGNDQRPTSAQHFKGSIYSVSIFDDVRTAEEIALDTIAVTDDEDGVLYIGRFVSQR